MNPLPNRNTLNRMDVGKSYNKNHLCSRISNPALSSPVYNRLLFSRFSCKRFHGAQTGHSMFAEHHDAASTYGIGVNSGCRCVEVAREAQSCETAPSSMNVCGNLSGGQVR